MLAEVKHYPLVDIETVGTQKKSNYLDRDWFCMHFIGFIFLCKFWKNKPQMQSL